MTATALYADLAKQVATGTPRRDLARLLAEGAATLCTGHWDAAAIARGQLRSASLTV